MKTKRYRLLIIIFFSVIGFCKATEEPNSETAVFESASTVEKVKNQFNQLPKNDIWWTKNVSNLHS